MKQRLIASLLAASLLSLGPFAAAQQPPSNPQTSPAVQSRPTSSRPSRARSRPYRREVSRRRCHHISKQEALFLAGIAGTSMGIGAIAGGPKGLAIGSIVGGWGAYAGHRLWNKIR